MVNKSVKRQLARLGSLAAIGLLLMLCLAACNKSPRARMHEAQFALMAQDYQTALEEYDKVLEAQPDSKMAKFGKANALYGLRRWEEALALYEEFLTATQNEPGTYKDERYDAQFRGDKCRQELGMVVEQDPEAIPPPPMGE